jgi:hypothetical protein
VSETRCLASAEVLPGIMKRCVRNAGHSTKWERHLWLESWDADGRDPIIVQWDDGRNVETRTCVATTGGGESGACGCTLGPDRGDGKARGFNPCPEHAITGPRDFEG